MKRQARQHRQTLETDIKLDLSLTAGPIAVNTGIGFFDHMLHAMAFHAGWTLSLAAEGDLAVDGHHTVEDTGITLGLALKEALGDKRGIARFGTASVPMDEALAAASLDLSGRSYLAYNCQEGAGETGSYDKALTREFLRAFCINAGITLHLRAEGENAHHITEALFKALGRALRAACVIESDGGALPSTKGVL